jgi:hypothetical protein
MTLRQYEFDEEFGPCGKTKSLNSYELQAFGFYSDLNRRRDRDSNPGYPLGVYTLSRRAP